MATAMVTKALQKLNTAHSCMTLSKTTVATLATLLLFSHSSFAATIETYAQVGLTQSIEERTTDAETSTINSTSISPSYQLKLKKNKLDLSIDYRLTGTVNHEDSTDDISHQLNLIADIQHTENIWNSRFQSQISRRNTSDTGLLTSDETTTSDSVEDYVVHSFSTRHQKVTTDGTALISALNLSDQGFRGETSQTNVGLSFGAEKQHILPKTDIEAYLNTSKSSSNQADLNTLSLQLNYNTTRQLTNYLYISEYDSSGDTLDATSYLVGVNLSISDKNYASFDIGKTGGSDSWRANVQMTMRRTTFSFIHNEAVSQANQQLVDNIALNNPTFADSIDDTLSFNKNSSINIHHQARRFSHSLFISQDSQFSEFDGSSDRTSKSLAYTLHQNLNSKNQLTYTASHYNIKTAEENKLLSFSVKWATESSKDSRYHVKLSHEEQDSTNSLLNYQQVKLNFTYNLSF